MKLIFRFLNERISLMCPTAAQDIEQNLKGFKMKRVINIIQRKSIRIKNKYTRVEQKVKITRSNTYIF